MKKVLVCYKWVIDERDIFINTDLSLETKRSKYKISDYDLNAIEEAVKIKEAFGAEVWGITVGEAVQGSVKNAFSRGIDQILAVECKENETQNPLITSKLIAAAVKQLGEFDLIIFGQGSSDNFSRQVGHRVAQLLKIPSVTSVNELRYEDGQVQAFRKLEYIEEVIKVGLPASISVLNSINCPRIPGMKQIIAANKKPVTKAQSNDLVDAKHLYIDTDNVEIRAIVPTRKKKVFKGELGECADMLFKALSAEGVL